MPVGWKKRARTAAEKEAGEAMLTLVRLGWGQENPAFRQMFTSQFIPGATKEQADWFNEFQRICCSPADAARNLIANGDVDVMSLLPQVRVPTLVMHARHDARVPFEAGRRLAAGIPGARFVPLESQNHVLMEDEPAFTRFLEEIRAFLQPNAGSDSTRLLSRRALGRIGHLVSGADHTSPRTSRRRCSDSSA